MGMKEKEDQRLGNCSKSNLRIEVSEPLWHLIASIASFAVITRIRGAIGIIGDKVARGVAKRHTDVDQTQFYTAIAKFRQFVSGWM